MTTPSSSSRPDRSTAAALWHDQTFAAGWAQGDDLRDLLALPRVIATALVAEDWPAPGLVIDIASGPGDFLAVFLDAFPAARGVWSDVSDPMRELARQRLAGYHDRVEYRSADMTDLANADLPAGAAAVLTSRASHHLDSPALYRFYRAAAGLLAPGGWLVNLDHTGHEPGWDARLRSARQRLRRRPEREGDTHRYGHPMPTVAEHLAALTAAGLGPPEIAWKAFVTCLFVARRPA